MNTPTAMLLINPITNQILQANHQGKKLFKLACDDLSNQTVTQFFPECIDKLIHFSQQVASQGNAWSSDLSIKVNNDIIHLEVNATLVDENILMSCQNSVESFARYHKAIVESNYQSGLAHWRKNETAFEEIERQNQLLLTAVGDGIYGVDNQGKTTFVNAAAEHITGWKREDLIGKKIHDVMHHTHPDGSHYHVHDCPIYAAFNDGAIHSVDDEVFWSKSGKPIPVEYTSTPVTEYGMLIGAVVIFRDITERKGIQEKLLSAKQEVESLQRRLEMENAYLLEELNADFNHHQIIGQSAQVQHMVQQIELVAPTNANVLIIGESGTGKELIARAIHEVSDRKARSLIRVNCAAIPAELFESEFFGHVKGAFSGAISDRVGRFELADGATIFLDEVGEIPIQLQGKLLRVLQEQQFERVGDSRTTNVDVRVISATNKDLKQLVKENKFREDLYYRLNVFPIQSPSLRDRIADLPLLVKYFIDKVCLRLNKPQPKVSLAQMQLLEQYHWPGNIRELENIIERQVILAQADRISFDFLAAETVKPKPLVNTKTPSEVMSATQHKALEKSNIEQALKQCTGKIYGYHGAASLLGLKPTTLASKIKKYDINRHDV
jgi:PAS domain S-box-containing protein